jgi:hypothetical protein
LARRRHPAMSVRLMSGEFTFWPHKRHAFASMLMRKRASHVCLRSLYRFGEHQGPNMIILRAPQNVSAWLESNLMGLPPKDPHDDEDENEQDEEDNDEDDEPAVIREPDE